jgi:hypothetical protein
MNEVLDKIRTKGYWRVIIRPTVFLGKRLQDIASLETILRKTFVQFRGWDFPHIDRQLRIHVDQDWVGQELDWDITLEHWRFYQSGQFVHYSGMPIDWRNQSGFWPASEDKDWKAGTFMDVIETVFRFTEIFEFVARLALTEAGDERMHIEVGLRNLKGRKLWLDSSSRRAPFFEPYVASVQDFTSPVDLERSDLAAHPREHAIRSSLELFKRFNWNPSLELLRNLQSELRR